LQFNPIPPDDGQAIGEFRLQQDAILRRLGTRELDHITDRVIDVQPIHPMRSLFDEITDAADDVAGPICVAHNAAERFPDLLQIWRILIQKVQGRIGIVALIRLGHSKQIFGPKLREQGITR
jgi:hypothetical protein